MNDGSPVPGWYHDGQGLRWWSGEGWGPAAPPQGWVPPGSDEAGRSWALAAHLGAFAGGFVVPLIVYLTQKDKNAFARHHAAEALNFQITLGLAQLGMFAAFVASAVLSAPESDASAGMPWPVIVVFLGFPIVIFGSMALAVLGAVRANQLVWWRYPIRIPFVRAASDR